MTLSIRVSGPAAFVLLFAFWPARAVAQFPISRASLDSAGHEGDGSSGVAGRSGGFFEAVFHPSPITSDHRYVAFVSDATNLVVGDTNQCADVFVRDRLLGATVRVSIDSAGNEADGQSRWPAMSGDGRFVAFQSAADNLVAGDTNGVEDVFLHDRDPDGNGIFDEGNGTTICVSVSSSGVIGDQESATPSLSDDGRVVAFASSADNLVHGDVNQFTDVFVHDVATGVTTRLSPGGNGYCWLPSISADGKFVAFTSDANNLVPGDTNRAWDVFVRDVANATTTRVSVDSSGGEANERCYGPSPLSADGSVVAFASWASNLVPGDTNGTYDVFVHDIPNGATTRVSVDSSGAQFDNYCESPALSADGSLVAFERFSSSAGGLFDGYDIYLRDRTAATTTPISFNCGGVPANGNSMLPTLSADGEFVGFLSFASDLVWRDGNGVADVFVHDRSIIEPDASMNQYGGGYPGTLGIPDLSASAEPVLGTTISLDVGNSFGFFTVGFLLVGWNEADVPSTKGGDILVDLAFIQPLAVWPGGSSFPLDLPIDPGLCGFSTFFQVVEMDSGAQYGLSFTPGLELTFGL